MSVINFEKDMMIWKRFFSHLKPEMMHKPPDYFYSLPALNTQVSNTNIMGIGKLSIDILRKKNR